METTVGSTDIRNGLKVVKVLGLMAAGILQIVLMPIYALCALLSGIEVSTVMMLLFVYLGLLSFATWVSAAGSLVEHRGRKLLRVLAVLFAVGWTVPVAIAIVPASFNSAFALLFAAAPVAAVHLSVICAWIAPE